MSETQPDPARPNRRPMQLVHEQLVPDPVQPISSPQASIPRTTSPAPPDLSREFVTRTAWRQGVIASLNVATQILAVRLILLLAVIGAFTLGWRAVSGGQPMQLAAVGLYTLTVVLPITWLSSRR